MRCRLSALFYTLIFLQSCAEGSPDPISGSDIATQSDTSIKRPEKDTGTASPDGGRKNICTPNQQLCDGQTRVKTCRSDGSGFDATLCELPQICAAGLCKAPPICTPGEKKCADPGTVSTCRSSGEAWSAMSCNADQACVKGACLVGKINGSDCANNAECASNTCHCGAEENCGFEQAGFCVSKGCESGCESGFCFDGQVLFAGRTIGYDFCLQRCDGACDSPTQQCHDLPSKDGFDKGCYFESLNAIGGHCSTQSDCAGDVCRQDYFTESNLCTRNCDATTPCPDGTGCVDLGGVFQCTLICGDGSAVGTGPCPLDLPTDRFDVTCKTTTTAQGDALRVCVKP